MFTMFLKELGGYFDRHWLLSAFFPSMAFWAACLLIYVAVRGFTETLQLWQGQTAGLQAILIVIALGGITFFALLLGNFQTGLIRFYEGYWQHFPLTWLRKRRLIHYQNKSRYLQERIAALTQKLASLKAELQPCDETLKQEANEISRELGNYEREWLLFYPFQLDKVMPTQLGNIIRAAELYAFGRYGIDAVVIWPRLYPYVPETFSRNLLSAKTSMTLMLVVSALAFTFGLVICTLLFFLTDHWLLLLVCALSFPLAWFCYRNSLYSGRLYAELIKTAFDLYRWELLKALHIELPVTYQEELRIWEDINHLIYRNEALLLAKYDNQKLEFTTGGRT